MTNPSSINGSSAALARVILHNRKKREKEKLTGGTIPSSNSDDRKTSERAAIIPSCATVDPTPDKAVCLTKKRKRCQKKELKTNRISLGTESSLNVLDQPDDDELTQHQHRAAALTDMSGRLCPNLQDQNYQLDLQNKQLETDMLQREAHIQLMERELQAATDLVAQMVNLEAKRHKRFLEQQSQIYSLEQRVNPLEKEKQALMARLEVVEQENDALMQQKQVLHCSFQDFAEPPALLLEAPSAGPCTLETGQDIQQGELNSLSVVSPLFKKIGHGSAASATLEHGNCGEEDTHSKQMMTTVPLVHLTIQQSIGLDLEAEQGRMIFLQHLPLTRAMIDVFTENKVSSQSTLLAKNNNNTIKNSSSSSNHEIQEECHLENQIPMRKPDHPTNLGKRDGKICNKESRLNAVSIPQPNLYYPMNCADSMLAHPPAISHSLEENSHFPKEVQDCTASEFSPLNKLKCKPQASTAANQDKALTKSLAKSTFGGTARDKEEPPSSKAQDPKSELSLKAKQASAGAKFNEAAANSSSSTKAEDNNSKEIFLSSNMKQKAKKTEKENALVFSDETEVVLFALKDFVGLEDIKIANSYEGFKDSKAKTISSKLVIVEQVEKVVNGDGNSAGTKTAGDNKVAVMEYEKQEKAKSLINQSEASPRHEADEAALPRGIESAGILIHGSSLRNELTPNYLSGKASPRNDDIWNWDDGKKASKSSCLTMPPQDWTKAKEKSKPEKWMTTRKLRQEKKQSSLDHFVKRTPKECNSDCDSSNRCQLSPKEKESSDANKRAELGSGTRTANHQGRGLCDGSKSQTEEPDLDLPCKIAAPVQKSACKSKQHLTVKCQRHRKQEKPIVKGSKQDKTTWRSAPSAKNVYPEEKNKQPLANKLTSFAAQTLQEESTGPSSKRFQVLHDSRASEMTKQGGLVFCSDKLDSKAPTLKAEDKNQAEKHFSAKEVPLKTCKHSGNSVQHNIQTSHLPCTQGSQLKVATTNKSFHISEHSKKVDTKAIGTLPIIVSTVKEKLKSQESETQWSSPANVAQPAFSNSLRKPLVASAASTQGSKSQWCPSNLLCTPSSCTPKTAQQESNESKGSPLNAVKHWHNADTQESATQWNPCQPSGKPFLKLADTQATELTQYDTRMLVKPSRPNDFNDFYAKTEKSKDSPAKANKKRKLPKVSGRGWLCNRQGRAFDRESDAAVGVRSAPKQAQRRTRARSHQDIPVRFKSSNDVEKIKLTECPEQGHKMSSTPEFAWIQGRGGKQARDCGDCDKRDCIQCRDFYKALRTQGVHLAERSQSRLNYGLEHSRHTKWSTAAKPDTPPQFWEMSFADSQRKQQEVETLADAE